MTVKTGDSSEPEAARGVIETRETARNMKTEGKKLIVFIELLGCRFVVTYQVGLHAVITGMQVMMPGEIIPMLSLRGAQGSGSVTDRAGITQGRQNRAADEI
jgi:hypothetical protein